MTEWTGQRLGGYLLEEELGRDAMGVLYRGTQLALEREVAVKVLPRHLSRDPAAVARFLRQARILAQLNHPHIVQIYDAGQHNDVLYIVLEYVQGLTIRSLLDLDGKLPQHLAASYAAQVADALEAAYQECRLIHRNITPENLLLDWRGQIRVTDFSLALAQGLPPITTGPNLRGSLSYASPEQIYGQPLDHRSDIYVLGIVLYEMVTGSRPFTGRTLRELAQAITAGRLIPPTVLVPEVSLELEYIIMTALATNRDERFARAGLMADTLRALHLHTPSIDSGSHSRRESVLIESERSEMTASAPRPYIPLIPRRLTLPMREPPTPGAGALAPNDVDITEKAEEKPGPLILQEKADQTEKHPRVIASFSPVN